MFANVTEERALMGRISGLLWLAAAAVAAIGWLLPGATRHDPVLFWSIFVGVVAYGLACVTGAIPWGRASYGAHLAAVLAAQPVIGVVLWLTGGGHSFVAPILVLALMYAAFFLPPRMGWIGVGALALTNASVLLYIDDPADHVARALAFAVACVGLTLTLQLLKRRLLAAEAHQHEMAHRDPLTGLANRRGFDEALRHALADAGRPERGRRADDDRRRFALLLVDIDDFKGVNDGYGHSGGDRVLREIATRAGEAVRPGDCVARIGGDELAIVAPGAGETGARRLADALAAGASTVRPDPDADPVSLTVAWALFPEDGDDAAGLFRAADRGLHASKRARRSVAAGTRR